VCGVLEAIIFVVFPFAMVFAALSDLFTMTIANRVSLLLIATFALVAPFTGMDMATYGMHFAAGALVLACGFIGFAMGGVGGGDAKLLTAVAVWCGFSDVLVEYLLYSAMLGGWLTLSILAYRGSFIAEQAGARFEFLERIGRKDAGVPYGIALGIGGLIVAHKLPLMAWALERAAG
jgi:prepilin peptidase CpaA